MVPRVDVFKCEGCGTCIKRCPPQIMGFIKKKAAILIDLCEECGICHEVCPRHAIHFRLPNQAVEDAHEGYEVVREFTPHPGCWTAGVPRGHDQEGNYEGS
jgi:ferredoxin